MLNSYVNSFKQAAVFDAITSTSVSRLISTTCEDKTDYRLHENFLRQLLKKYEFPKLKIHLTIVVFIIIIITSWIRRISCSGL
jgi:hypothetical protein